MAYKVKAECVDYRTGKRFVPGDTFPDPEADQAERLVKAGCLLEVKGRAPKQPTDGLDELDELKLRELAHANEVEGAAEKSPAELIGLLRAKSVKAPA